MSLADGKPASGLPLSAGARRDVDSSDLEPESQGLSGPNTSVEAVSLRQTSRTRLPSALYRFGDPKSSFSGYCKAVVANSRISDYDRGSDLVSYALLASDLQRNC